MKILLLVVGSLLWVLGLGILVWAPSVTQEILASMVVLNGTVMIGSAAVMDSVDSARAAIKEAASVPPRS